jgi:hypothetical protein
MDSTLLISLGITDDIGWGRVEEKATKPNPRTHPQSYTPDGLNTSSNRGTKQSEEPDVLESPTLSRRWITSRVAQCIGHSARQPDDSSHRANDWVPNPAHCQKHQEGWISLQEVALGQFINISKGL